MEVPSAGDIGGAGGCSSLSLTGDAGGIEGDWSSQSLMSSSELSEPPDAPSGSPLSVSGKVWVLPTRVNIYSCSLQYQCFLTTLSENNTYLPNVSDSRAKHPEWSSDPSQK